MATGLQARYDAASDPAFLKRVGESIAEAAVAIYNEGTGVAGHAARAAYASRVLASPGGYAPAFAQAIVTQGADQTSTDTVINNAVASVWNALASA